MLKVKILETTIRDGSYAVDFQFTVQDTINIAKNLERLGFEYIEIGHGLGLNAAVRSKESVLVSDEEYLQAASLNLKTAKWGTFFIPGIGRKSDIKKALDYKMDFIRIGTNISELEKAEQYIGFAKKKGLFVTANLMKSYALPSKEFAKKVKRAQEMGADVVYLVDSAGGMLPEDIRNYFAEAKAISTVSLGFHGHNNLQLAIANTLEAIKSGACLVDSSMQGLGRSAGNAPTEVLVLLLRKQGLLDHIDVNQLMDFSEKSVKPLLKEKGLSSIDLTSGYAQFHSSYLSTVFKYAERYRIDPRELIVGLCKKDLISAPEELVESISKELAFEKHKKTPERFVAKKIFNVIKQGQYLSLEGRLRLLIREIQGISKKFGRRSVFNIVQPAFNKDKSNVSQFIQESFSFVIGSAEVASLKDLKRVMKIIKGKVEIILYDAEPKLHESKSMISFLVRNTSGSKLFLYRDTEVWVKAIENLILEATKGKDKRILLVGNSRLILKLGVALQEVGQRPFYYCDKRDTSSFSKIFPENTIIKGFPENKKMDFIVGLDPAQRINIQFSNLISSNTLLIDGCIGAFSKSFIRWAQGKNIKMLRVDMRAAIDAEVKQKYDTHQMYSLIAGKKNIKGIECVAGGYYGKKGSVVLDSITDPKCVIGLATGEGKIRYSCNRKEERIIKTIEEELFA